MKVTYLIHTETLKNDWVEDRLYTLCKLKAETALPYAVVVDKHFPLECWESGVHELFYESKEKAEEKYLELLNKDYRETYF